MPGAETLEKSIRLIRTDGIILQIYMFLIIIHYLGRLLIYAKPPFIYSTGQAAVFTIYYPEV